MINEDGRLKRLARLLKQGVESIALPGQGQSYREELEQANRDLRELLFLYQQDQQAGHQMQMKLYPPGPMDTAGYHFDYRLVPSFYLSGDFLDYQPFGKDELIFCIADVSGHGAASAFVTAILRHLMQKLVRDKQDALPEAPSTPADILHYFNRELVSTAIDRHVTMVVGLIHIPGNTLRYSVAGHLPLPILVTPDKTVYLEGNKGMPLGLSERVIFRDCELVLPEVFSIMACTDGIFEILPVPGLLDKEKYLLELAARSRTVEVLSATLEFNDMKAPPDDIAVLAINRGLS